MTWRISRRQTLTIAALAATVGWLPWAIGEWLGFAGFVVTPVVMVLVLIPLGSAVAHIAPAARWSGIALATFVQTITFLAVPAAMTMALNGRLMAMHVEVRPAEFPSFTRTLQSILKAQGAEAAINQASEYDPDPAIYNLDAGLGWIHIFASGTLVADEHSPDEHSPCAGQSLFTINVQPYLSFYGRPDAVYDRLEKILVARGYDVRDKPFPCGRPRSVP